MAEPGIIIISSDSENEGINDSIIVISTDSEGELVPGQFSDAESTGLGEIAEFEGLGASAAVEGVATLDEDLGEYEGEGSEGTEWDGSGWEADWEDWSDVCVTSSSPIVSSSIIASGRCLLSIFTR